MRLLVLATGAASSLGLDSPTIQAEMATRTVRFTETGVLDRQGEPLRAASLSVLDGVEERTARMVFLAQWAARRALQGAAEMSVGSIPVFLALPEEGAAPYDQRAVRWAVVQTAPAGVRLESSRRRCYSSGRAGMVQALRAAERSLQTSGTLAALVGGVDSLVDSESMRRLLLQRRLLANTNDGTIPGEGAGFLLVTLADGPLAQQLSKEQLSSLPLLVGAVSTKEPNPLRSGQINSADGLTQALAQLQRQASLGESRVDHVVTCQTGEHFFSREFALAYLRNASMMPEPLSLEVLAEFFGDLGAAAGPLAFVRAEWLLAHSPAEQGETPRPRRVLVCGSADAGPVGAFLVEGPATVRCALDRSLALALRAPERPAETRSSHRKARAFHDQLFEEHLEEVGFLVFQRQEDLARGLQSWTELATVEQRIARHLEALRLGQAEARAYAHSVLDDPDDDVVLGALCLMVQESAPDEDLNTLAVILPRMDDDQLALGWQAVRLFAHRRLGAILEVWSRLERLDLAVASVRLMGHARVGDRGHLEKLATDRSSPPPVRDEAVRSLVRLSSRQAQPALRRVLGQAAEPSLPLLWALLATRREEGLSLLRQLARRPAEQLPAGALLLLAQAGTASDGALLRQALDLPGWAAEASLALGVLGLPEDVPLLLENLAAPRRELRSGAAEALEQLLGGPPNEPTPSPKRLTRDRSVCLSSLTWQVWWEAQRDHFRQGSRYRRGKPFSLARCLAEAAGHFALSVRQRAADELRFRWGRPLDLEPDWRADRQLRALARLRTELAQESRLSNVG